MDYLAGEISKHQTKYVVIGFQDDINDIDRKRTVDNIKKYFDIFLIIKSDFTNHRHRIEEYFSYGVHGLYFDTSTDVYSVEQVEIMSFATELFVRGWVFARVQSNKSIIGQLLSLKVIPVPSLHDPELIEFIKSHQSFHKFSPNLKLVPLLDRNQCDYSLTDKIKMKMLLEIMNLRQKLMVKNIDESFGASGL